MRGGRAWALAAAFMLSVASNGCSHDGGGAAGGVSPMGGAGGSDAGAPEACTATYAEAQSSAARTPASGVAPAALASAVAANNAFALDLYAHVLADPAAAPPNANVVLSPLSASIALTMTYAGAKGTTASQMASALHLDASSSIFDGQNALLQALGGRAAQALAADTQLAASFGAPAPPASGYQLELVNAVWGEKAYPWSPSFLDVLAQSYGTGVRLADFSTDAAADAARQSINGWVSCATDGEIEGLLPPASLGCSTRMVLVDAVHLKLPWAAPFDPQATAPKTFTTGAGTAVSAPFMGHVAESPYVDDGQAQILGLPLSGSQLALLVALPHGDLAAYEAALAAGSATLALPAKQAYVDMALPKFSFASPSISLRRSLEEMGMLEAFGDEHAYRDGLGKADLGGLVAGPLPAMPCSSLLEIADVLQKATISATEGGLEAAAATAVSVGTKTASTGPPTVPFLANHPFVVAIVDGPTGALLFLGHVEDPTTAPGG